MGQRPSAPHDSLFSETYDDIPSARDLTDLTSSIVLDDEHFPPTPVHPPEQRKCENVTAPLWIRDDVDLFTCGGPIPANIRPKNIILFGETGVGKSSVINLMADAEVASTSSSLMACTMESTEYTFTLSGDTPFRIYDSAGLNETEMGVNTFLGAIKKAHELVKTLHSRGGIDLLIFCISGRLTATMKRNYGLFFEFLCDKQIPLAVVVTRLENEDCMEGWWEKNEETLRKGDIQLDFHACITAAPDRTMMIAGKRRESRQALHHMLHEAFSYPSTPYLKEEKDWLFSLLEFFKSISIFNPHSWSKKAALTDRLEKSCAFSRSDAEKVADMLLE